MHVRCEYKTNHDSRRFLPRRGLAQREHHRQRAEQVDHAQDQQAGLGEHAARDHEQKR